MISFYPVFLYLFGPQICAFKVTNRMNANRNHRHRLGGKKRGCARNTTGGANGWTTATTPLIPGRPDLAEYLSVPPGAPCSAIMSNSNNPAQFGSGYEVNVSEQIADMPVYQRNASGCTGLCTMKGGLQVYNAPVAGYTFEPSTGSANNVDYMEGGVPFNMVVPIQGRACAPTSYMGGRSRKRNQRKTKQRKQRSIKRQQKQRSTRRR